MLEEYIAHNIKLHVCSNTKYTEVSLSVKNIKTIHAHSIIFLFTNHMG